MIGFLIIKVFVLRVINKFRNPRAKRVPEGTNSRSNNKKGNPMSHLTVQEKIHCLKNLLSDPDDWISAELLRLDNAYYEGTPDATSNSNPEASS